MSSTSGDGSMSQEMDDSQRNTTAAVDDSATYTRRPVNRLELGVQYEEANVVAAFLTLREDQALGREVVEADKFDDLVIRVNSGDSQKYYFRQFKHKQDDGKTITWDDLLANSGPFSLKVYYESFLKVVQKATFSLQELSLATNIGLVTIQSQPPRNSLNQANKQKKQPLKSGPITSTDATQYFEIVKPDETIYNPITRGKGISYKLNKAGVCLIEPMLLSQFSSTTTSTNRIQEFLSLLVFDVNQPDIKELENISQFLIKLNFPFLGQKANENLYTTVKRKVLELFDVTQESTSNQASGTKKISLAEWATVDKRGVLFDEIIPDCKQKVSLGTVKGYEFDTIDKLYKKLHLNLMSTKKLHERLAWFSALRDFLTSISPADAAEPQNVLNIVSKGSNPTITALKAYKLLEDSGLLNRSVIVRVNDNTGAESIKKHFIQLTEELNTSERFSPQRFCFIIECSPAFGEIKEEPDGRSSYFVEFLAELEHLREWIQFVVITQHAVEDVGYAVVDDSPLRWEDLPGETKILLVNKTLKVGSNLETSLMELFGFDDTETEKWLMSNILADLIVYDENNKMENILPFPLPSNDRELESMYINRTIRLPVFQINDEIKQDLGSRVVTSEEEYNEKVRQSPNEKFYLFLPHREGGSDRSSNSFRWSKGNFQTLQEMKNFVLRNKESSLEVDEKYLLDDEVWFGSGCDGRLAIVVDDPGKGKTSLLGSLSNHFWKTISKAKNVNRFLFCISLIEHTGFCNRKVQNGNEALNFLLDILFDARQVPSSEQAYVADSLARNIVRNMCLNSTKPRIILMYDGFDEITKDGREVVSQMIEKLLEVAPGIKRIILTSRPDNNLTEILEDRFQRFVLHLSNFTTDDQINFLTERWSKALANGEGDRIRKFAEHLVKKVNEKMKDEDYGSVLGIPLQCLIFSECFLDKLEQHLINTRHICELRDGDDTKSSDADDGRKLPEFDSDSFKLLRLYENFVAKKMEILILEKTQFPTDPFNDASSVLLRYNRTNLLDTLKRLAIFYMMQNVGEAEKLAGTTWKAYSSHRPELQASTFLKEIETATKLGMLRGTSEQLTELDRKRFKFIHRTFAEYFLALYIHDNFKLEWSDLLDENELRSEEKQTEVFLVITEHILYESQYAGTKRFFDRMLQESLPDCKGRCPFAIAGHKNLTKQFPTIAHATFNKFIAHHFMTGDDISPLSIDRTCDIIEDGFITAGTFPPPCVQPWLLLCMKERVVSSAFSVTEASVLAEKVGGLYLDGLKQIAYMMDEWSPIDGINLANAMRWLDTPQDLELNKRLVLSKLFLSMFSFFVDSCIRFGPLYIYVNTSAVLLELAKYHVYESELKRKIEANIWTVFENVIFCRSRLTQLIQPAKNFTFKEIETYDDSLETICSLDYEYLMPQKEFVKRLFDLFSSYIKEINNLLENETATCPCLTPNVIFVMSKHLLARLEQFEMYDEVRELSHSWFENIVISFNVIFRFLLSDDVRIQRIIFSLEYLTSIPDLISREKDKEKILSIFISENGRRFITGHCLATNWKPTVNFISKLFAKCPRYKGRSTQQQLTEGLKKVLVVIQETQGEEKLVEFLDSINPEAYSSQLILSCIKILLTQESDQSGQLKQTSQWLDKAFRALWSNENEQEFVKFLLELPNQVRSSHPIQNYIEKLSADALNLLQKIELRPMPLNDH